MTFARAAVLSACVWIFVGVAAFFCLILLFEAPTFRSQVALALAFVLIAAVCAAVIVRIQKAALQHFERQVWRTPQ